MSKEKGQRENFGIEKTLQVKTNKPKTKKQNKASIGRNKKSEPFSYDPILQKS